MHVNGLSEKSVDWIKRQKLLESILKNKRRESYDCIIPVMGIDTTAPYTVKKKYNINPLCITVRPPLELNLGSENLSNY